VKAGKKSKGVRKELSNSQDAKKNWGPGEATSRGGKNGRGETGHHENGPHEKRRSKKVKPNHANTRRIIACLVRKKAANQFKKTAGDKKYYQRGEKLAEDRHQRKKSPRRPRLGAEKRKTAKRAATSSHGLSKKNTRPPQEVGVLASATRPMPKGVRV